MGNNLSIEFRDGIRIVRFTNPERRNPLTRDVLERLHSVVADVSEPIVFTGSDNVFASGANLNEIAALTAEEAPAFARYGQNLMNAIADLPYPTVAAVNGFCFGGALDLALSCSYRIGSPSASFAHPGAGLGIITGWGGTQRLPRLIGTVRALEMIFIGAPIDAEDALKFGLINEIADDPVAASLACLGAMSL